MIKSVKLNIEVKCPGCGQDSSHEHSFAINSTVDVFDKGGATAIGHTKVLYENSFNSNCPECNCLFSTDVDPIEIHAFIKYEGKAVTVLHEQVYGSDKATALFMPYYVGEDMFWRVYNLKDVMIKESLPSLEKAQEYATRFGYVV